MKSNPDHIHTEFFDKAKGLFFIALKDFQYSTKKLNRNLEEYKFNQMKEQHVFSLKQRLEDAARLVMEFNRDHKQIREVDLMMQQTIKMYLHQFVLRTQQIY